MKAPIIPSIEKYINKVKYAESLYNASLDNKEDFFKLIIEKVNSFESLLLQRVFKEANIIVNIPISSNLEAQTLLIQSYINFGNVESIKLILKAIFGKNSTIIYTAGEGIIGMKVQLSGDDAIYLTTSLTDYLITEGNDYIITEEVLNRGIAWWQLWLDSIMPLGRILKLEVIKTN